MNQGRNRSKRWARWHAKRRRGKLARNLDVFNRITKHILLKDGLLDNFFEQNPLLDKLRSE